MHWHVIGGWWACLGERSEVHGGEHCGALSAAVDQARMGELTHGEFRVVGKVEIPGMRCELAGQTYTASPSSQGIIDGEMGVVLHGGIDRRVKVGDAGYSTINMVQIQDMITHCVSISRPPLGCRPFPSAWNTGSRNLQSTRTECPFGTRTLSIPSA